jgi:hypothetical protein
LATPSIWKAALDAVVARRIAVAVTITVAVAGGFSVGEFSTALITTLLARVTSMVESASFRNRLPRLCASFHFRERAYRLTGAVAEGRSRHEK